MKIKSKFVIGQEMWCLFRGYKMGSSGHIKSNNKIYYCKIDNTYRSENTIKYRVIPIFCRFRIPEEQIFTTKEEAEAALLKLEV